MTSPLGRVGADHWTIRRRFPENASSLGRVFRMRLVGAPGTARATYCTYDCENNNSRRHRTLQKVLYSTNVRKQPIKVIQTRLRKLKQREQLSRRSDTYLQSLKAKLGEIKENELREAAWEFKIMKKKNIFTWTRIQWVLCNSALTQIRTADIRVIIILTSGLIAGSPLDDARFRKKIGWIEISDEWN